MARSGTQEKSGEVVGAAAALSEVTALVAPSLQTEVDLNAETTAPVEVDIDPKLTPVHRHELLHLLHEFHDYFATVAGVGTTTVGKHRIITDDAALPVHQPPYQISLQERKVFHRQVCEMLEDDVIQLSKSPGPRR